MTSMDQPNLQKISLAEREELRIEIEKEKTAFIKLVSGTAELFGTELAKDKLYTLSPASVGVFTWHGCELQVWGDFSWLTSDSSRESMQFYANIHAVLDDMRRVAKENSTVGPRVIIVGPTDAGKSTLSRILINYAVRRGWEPTYIDIDVGQGSITVPGNLSAVLVPRPIDIETGLRDIGAVLAHFFGYDSPKSNLDLYRTLFDRLMMNVNARFSKVPAAAASGFVINTCGWIEDKGRDLIRHCITASGADVVLVVGDEYLYKALSTSINPTSTTTSVATSSSSTTTTTSTTSSSTTSTAKAVKVVNVPRPGGVKARSTSPRRLARTNRVKEYFYGSRNQNSPSAMTLRLNDTTLLRVSETPPAPTTTLPLGANAKLDQFELETLKFDGPTESALKTAAMLSNSLAAVLFATSIDDAAHAQVAGYVLIKDVNTDSKTVSILAPSATPLPSKLLLVGKIKVHID